MEMTNSEIVMRYRQAKKKTEQIGILAELNRCSNKQIVEILVDGGIKPTAFNRNRGKILDTKEPIRKKEPKKPEPAVTEAITVEKAIAALYDKARGLREQRDKIQYQLAEINTQLTRLSNYIEGGGDDDATI